jgi:uncharacterized protein YndB with AHSA1/START domain
VREEIVADHVVVVSTEIDASPDQACTALTDPKQIEKYMFGSKVETDWKPGSRSVWKGEHDGRQHEDHGEIPEVDLGRRLKLTRYSPLNGTDDGPENHHTIVYEIEEDVHGTLVG